jgi:hypothetical protein
MASLKCKSIRLCGFLPGLPTFVVILFPLNLLGAEQTNEDMQQPAPFDSLAYIDAPRDYLSGKIVSYASDIDRFFGDDRNYQETNNSVVQLALSKASGYGGSGKYVFAARANINLPSTEKRLHLLIESNPDQNITGEPPENQRNTPITTNVDKPQSVGLALRYEKVKEQLKAMHISADAGIKFQGITNVNPFARARASYSIPMDQWRLKAEQSVYWFNTIGVGETTQVDLEHLLSEPVLFRATSNATWLKDKQNFDLRQDFSIFHTLNERTVLLYQASMIGVSNPQWELTEDRLTFVYRYRLHRHWVFFNISPQLHFPKTENFKPKYSLSMSLNAYFDKSR